MVLSWRPGLRTVQNLVGIRVLVSNKFKKNNKNNNNNNNTIIITIIITIVRKDHNGSLMFEKHNTI